MRSLFSVFACGVLLAGCSNGGGLGASMEDASLRDTPHSTAEFLADHSLMERTVAACSAENDAEYNERMSHAGCKSVLQAMRESRHQAK